MAAHYSGTVSKIWKIVAYFDFEKYWKKFDCRELGKRNSQVMQRFRKNLVNARMREIYK